MGHPRRAERVACADRDRARRERQHAHVQLGDASPSRTPASRRPASASPTGSTRPPARLAADSSGNNVTGTAVGTTWTTGRFGGGASFDGVSDRIDLPALGTFYNVRLHVRGVGAQADRRRRTSPCSASWTGQRADDLGRPHRRPLPPHARRQHRARTSTPAARRTSASGSTSPRRTTGRPRASTSTASRWRAARSPAASARRTPGGSAPTAPPPAASSTASSTTFASTTARSARARSRPTWRRGSSPSRSRRS